MVLIYFFFQELLYLYIYFVILVTFIIVPSNSGPIFKIVTFITIYSGIDSSLHTTFPIYLFVKDKFKSYFEGENSQ